MHITLEHCDPPAKVIDGLSFSRCMQLTNVELCEGLVDFKREAFSVCKSLPCIMVPHLSKRLMRNMEFCDTIEKFYLWNHGVRVKSLLCTFLPWAIFQSVQMCVSKQLTNWPFIYFHTLFIYFRVYHLMRPLITMSGVCLN